MKIPSSKCIMPEMPYCPSCKHGYIKYPEWAETIADCEFCEWNCLLENNDESKPLTEIEKGADER